MIWEDPGVEMGSKNELCWFGALFADISYGDGHIHIVIPMSSEMTKPWSREISSKAKLTDFKVSDFSGKD